MSLYNFAQWLAETPGSIALHESLYMYSFVETAHVIGIMMFVGTIAMVDLRMLGLAFRQVPISELNQKILPWTVGGFVFMVATGLLLFYAIPVRTYQSVWFRLKLIFLALASINIFLFHWRVERDRAKWDEGTPPFGVKLIAGLSLTLWAGVIVTGRFIAYNWFDCDRPQSTFVVWFAGCQVEGI